MLKQAIAGFSVGLAIGLALVFAATTGRADEGPDEAAEYGALVDKPGVELTYAYCTACHSEKIVAQQGLTRKGWEDLFAWMVEEQGMPELEEPDRSIVLDYLSEHYNTDRPNFPNR